MIQLFSFSWMDTSPRLFVKAVGDILVPPMEWKMIGEAKVIVMTNSAQ